MKKRKRNLHRIAAIAIAAALIGNSLDFSAFAQDVGDGTSSVTASETASAVVTAFTSLAEEVTTQKLEVGAEESEITLPKSLEVTVTLTDAETSGGQADTDSTEEETQTEPKTETQSEQNADPAADGEEQTGETAAETQEPSTFGTEAPTQEPSTSGTEGQTQEPSAPGTEGQTQEQPATPGTETQTQEPSAPDTEAQTQETNAPVTEAPTQAESQAAAAAAVQSQEPKQAEPPTEAPVQREAPAATGAGTKEEKTSAEEGGVLTSFLDTVFPAMTAPAAEASDANPEPVTTTETIELTGITWEIDAEKSRAAKFSSEETAAGNTYTYVPVLPKTVSVEGAEYTLDLDDGVQLPEITVTIEEKETGVASVTIGGTATDFETIEAAWAAAKGHTDGATVTLLSDVESSEELTVADGDNITLTSEQNPNGQDYTIYMNESDLSAINISGGALTLESGYVYSANEACVTVSDGSLTVKGGTVYSGSISIEVNGGAVEISGGTIEGGNNCIKLKTSLASVTLSGGTFIGNETIYSPAGVASLLAVGYVYKKDGSLISNTTVDSLTGTITVEKCTEHMATSWTDAGNGTHTGICVYCGEKLSEKHTLDENGKCTAEGCTAQVSASVEIGGETTYYENLSDAFTAASSAGSAATVRLLADVSGTINDTGSFTVSGGTITFDLNGHTWTEGTMNSLLLLENCNMTLRDSSAGGTGEIKNTGRYSESGNGIRVDSGASLTVEGGSVTSSPGSSAYGISIFGGELTVSGGTISGEAFGVFLYSGSGRIEAGSIAGNTAGLYIGNVDKDAVTLAGGTYTNGIFSSTLTAGDLLGDGYGYYNGTDESWINDATAKKLTGTISIQATPVRITGEPSDLTLSYGFESGMAKLQVIAEKGATATEEISYQWYRVNAEDGGTDEALTDSEGYSGSRADTLVLPDSWVSGGSGSFYCVVSCGDYSVTSRTANVEITVCPHDQVVGGVCKGCGKTFEASVSDGTDGGGGYYETFEDAWAAVQSKTAVITLLADAEVSEVLTVTEGSDITLQSDPDQEEHTLCGNANETNGGLINVAGGTFTLSGGTVRNGDNGSNAIAVSGGTFIMNGGTAEALAYGHSGICVYSGGTAEINAGRASGFYGLAIVDGGSGMVSGGTFTGSSAAVYLRNVGSTTLKDILKPGTAYYSGTDATAETLITNLAENSLTGTVTVGDCTHSYESWTNNGDGTHTGTCVVCGHEETKPHAWGEDGKCTAEGCTAQLSVSVEIGGEVTKYEKIEDAWAAAKGSTATVTLLNNVTSYEELTVTDGDDITLTSAADAGGGTYTLSVKVSGYSNAILVSGGKLLLEGGTVTSGNSIANIGISVSGGSFTMTGGTVSGGRALYVAGGSVNISGGSVRTESTYGYGFLVGSDSVTLTGGTFYGDGYGSTTISSNDYTADQFLASGYAYKQGDSWISGTGVYQLTGTVTVEKAPVQSVSISPAVTTIGYGDDSPTLTAVVTRPEGSTGDVAYQWYLDGEAISGATGETYTPDSLDMGTYTYTCQVTAEGYSLTSEAATVTVGQTTEYTITIPATAVAGGEAVSVGINTAESFNLNGGTVSVSVSNGIDADGKLTLINTADSRSSVTSEMLVGGKTYTGGTVAEFREKSDPAVSLTFKEPEETDALAGTYEGIVTFSIEYEAAEGGMTK